ncbi:hypothetical protein KIN20_016844 [Parelaphostrongylus tenuis]|uniref:Uncharacterized protein n=1 Tax=Parelaphostrongylus tenuis TaxID=148309 RepID=A0AAD5QQ65_PARTN|nr:hypothetical protein KIN20_016844 [Parelaphostrongylus tenuis]
MESNMSKEVNKNKENNEGRIWTSQKSHRSNSGPQTPAFNSAVLPAPCYAAETRDSKVVLLDQRSTAFMRKTKCSNNSRNHTRNVGKNYLDGEYKTITRMQEDA